MAATPTDDDSSAEPSVFRGDESPEDVLDAAIQMRAFETEVSIGAREETLYVTGRVEEDGFTKHRVYEAPDDGGEYAGTVGFKRGFGDREPVVRYFPAGDDVDPEPVETVRVRVHDRAPQLASVLTALRTELTDTDWAVNPGRTGYGEWIRAANTLREFAAEECDYLTDEEEAVFQEPEVTHAVARYPLDAREVMNSVEVAVLRRDDLAFEDVNPEAVRSVLLQYASYQVE